MATIIKCPLCGKEFERISGAQKFCSAKCRIKWYAKHKVMKRYKTPKPTECGWCGLMFESKTKEEYCCAECRQKAENRKRNRRKNKNKLGLEAIAVAAHKEGLTYGQYVAKYGL